MEKLTYIISGGLGVVWIVIGILMIIGAVQGVLK